jgi:hypothetical protein
MPSLPHPAALPRPGTHIIHIVQEDCKLSVGFVGGHIWVKLLGQAAVGPLDLIGASCVRQTLQEWVWRRGQRHGAAGGPGITH